MRTISIDESLREAHKRSELSMEAIRALDGVLEEWRLDDDYPDRIVVESDQVGDYLVPVDQAVEMAKEVLRLKDEGVIPTWDLYSEWYERVDATDLPEDDE